MRRHNPAKKQAGADVQIVFLTDGCRSHAHLMSPNQLRHLRQQEALNAAIVLGVDQSDVIFLGFKDGSLINHQPQAIEKVSDLLTHYQPEEIFIPHALEEPTDHWVTHAVVLSALKQTRLEPTLYEYPIWCWRQWPWTSLMGRPREMLSFLKNTCKTGFGTVFLQEFRWVVDIEPVLDQKRQALEQHRSQMQRLLLDSEWATLADISNGEFLECFFQNYEFFSVKRHS